ncbi:MAG: hypothetical protein K9N55_03700 [Phycisphaerae bacterium]|nr:hypothetical protein [Phycisphaerae bacterium]
MKSILHTAAKSTQILVTGLILVWLVYLLQCMTIELVRLYVPQKVQTSRPYTQDPARVSFRFLPDGTVHQIRISQELDAQGKPQDMEEICDVNNILIERRPTPKEPDNTYLSFANGLYNAPYKGDLNSRYTITSGFSITMDIPVMEDNVLQEIWRYDRKREIFTGYDRTGKILGCLCKEGFMPDATGGTGLGEMQRYKWQHETVQHRLLWITQQDLYEIDVKARKVNHLAQCDKIYTGAIRSQAWYEEDETENGYVDPNVYRPLIVCQSDKNTYHLALRDPNQLITVSTPEVWQQWGGYCRFSATKTDLFMVRYWDDFRRSPCFYFESPKLYQQWAKEYLAAKKRRWTELYRIDDQGSLEQLKAFSWMETQTRDAPFLNRRPWTTQRWVQCLSPGLSIMGYKQLPAWYNSSEEYHEPFLFFLLKMMPQGPWDFVIPSLLFAAVAFWYGRPRWTSKGQAAFWLVFVLCFNLAGLLTYLALNHTPLIRCASCRQKRGLAADPCARCHAPLPLPAHTRPHLVSLRSGFKF